jgi:hypothetical protein
VLALDDADFFQGSIFSLALVLSHDLYDLSLVLLDLVHQFWGERNWWV